MANQNLVVNTFNLELKQSEQLFPLHVVNITKGFAWTSSAIFLIKEQNNKIFVRDDLSAEQKLQIFTIINFRKYKSIEMTIMAACIG